VVKVPKAVKYMGVWIKQCSKCKEFKKVEEFHKDKRRSDGLGSWCKECDYESEKQWRAKNPERLWARTTLNGHRKRGFEVDITIEALTELTKKAKTCPLCNCELDWNVCTKGKPLSNSPSLDRIGNTKTLTFENTWIICNRCNCTKNDRSLIEFARYCKNVSARLEDMGVKVE